jgi:hypothetical protein
MVCLDGLVNQTYCLHACEPRSEIVARIRTRMPQLNPYGMIRTNLTWGDAPLAGRIH